MKNVLLSIVAAVYIFSSGGLLASSTGDTYGGIQYALSTYNEDGFDEVKPTALVGRFGKYINNNFAIEGRLGFGLQDDSINFLGIDVTLDIDTLIGVYGLGYVNINDSSSVYGLIGFTRAEATASALGISVSSDESGLSFGVGSDLGIGNNVSLNIEYIQYLNKSNFDFRSLGLGIIFGF